MIQSPTMIAKTQSTTSELTNAIDPTWTRPCFEPRASRPSWRGSRASSTSGFLGGDLSCC